MNKLEYKEVLNALGIYNPINEYHTTEETHIWNNVLISFNAGCYAIIKGKIPLEVANIIYEMYPENQYNIRVNGGCINYIPKEHAIDDQYRLEIEQYINENLPSEEYIANCKNARRKMQRRKDDNKYIETYHIDTKEGLVILLTELKNYYLRKQGLKEPETYNFEKIISFINENIIEKVDPYINIYDWMLDAPNEKIRNLFLDSLINNNNIKYGSLMRQTLDNFDTSVNPYIDKELELDEIKNYSKKVNISAMVYNQKDKRSNTCRKKCCDMTIQSEFNHETRFLREPNGFSYQLNYELEKEKYLTVIHYFEEKGEYVYIAHFGNKEENKVDLRCNLTEGYREVTQDEKIELTEKDLFYIYYELLNATNYARTITIDNMEKPKRFQKTYGKHN